MTDAPLPVPADPAVPDAPSVAAAQMPSAPPASSAPVTVDIFQRLKRHKVVQWTLAYMALAYTLLHGAEMLGDALAWPHGLLHTFALLLILGTPVVAVLAWYHGARGVQRVRGTELLIVSLLLALSGFLLWRAQGSGETDGSRAAHVATVAVPAATSAATSAAPASAASAVPAASIAVLAFADMSASKDQEYFSDGMAEEILNALARIDGLKVTGRTSSFSFKGKNADLKTIGEALGVAHILEGSVRKQGNRVRISAQLVRATDGFHVWSDTFDGSLANIFDLQERIAREITGQLKVVLASGATRLVAKATDNPAAYTRFVEAQGLVNRRVDLARAITLLSEATALDPKFSRAWSKLAVANVIAPQYTTMAWSTGWATGEAAAHRALALDPANAESHAALGYMYLSRRNYLAMAESFDRALAADPNDPTALYWAANANAAMGRISAAEVLLDRILRTDPVNALALQYKGIIRISQGDMAAAQSYSQAGLAAGFKLAHIALAEAAASAGAYDVAATDFTAGFGAITTAFSESELRTIFHGSFDDASVRAAALATVDQHPQDQLAATMNLFLFEPARAFSSFEQSGSGVSDAFLVFLWQPLDFSRQARQHRAFQAFARRLGMIDYWKKYGWPDLCRPAPARGPDAFNCN